MAPAVPPLAHLRHLRGLGARIAKNWRARDYEAAAFATIASRALEEVQTWPSAGDVLEWTVRREGDHAEGLRGPASEAEVSTLTFPVYENEHFGIELVVWTEGFTTLTEVSGAIAVLSGGTVLRVGRVKDERELEPSFVLARTHTRSVEVLTAGAVRPLESHEFQVFAHFGRPVVAVVVRRTPPARANARQTYRSPTWSVTLEEPPLLMRRFDAMSTLLTLDQARFWKFWAREAERMDLACFYLVLFILVSDLDDERLVPVFRAARKAHGSKVDALLPACKEHLRQGQITRRWRRTRSVEHGFFFAVLVMAENRDQVLGLTKSLYPRLAPAKVLMKWIRELGPAGLDFQLDEAAEEVLSEALGHTPRTSASSASSSANASAKLERSRTSTPATRTAKTAQANRRARVEAELRDHALFAHVFTTENP